MTNKIEHKPEAVQIADSPRGTINSEPKAAGNNGLSLEDDVTLELRKELERFKTAFPKRVKLENETIEKGLAQLVLTLIEILRGVLEKQAIRKMDNQTLSDEETERVGAALMKLDEKITELCDHFGIDRKDLDLQLGPLDDLI